MNDTNRNTRIARIEDLKFETDIKINDEQAKAFLKKILEGDADVRDLLQSFTPKADTFQKQVIDASEASIRVVAPAGSGKTQTVINRAISQIKNGLDPKRILILTFDNSAATSINQKMEEVLAQFEARVDGPQISTLNAFGFGLLRAHVPNEHKDLAEKKFQRYLVKKILEKLKQASPDRFSLLPTGIQYNFYLDYFGLLKNELFDPRHVDGQVLADFIISTKQSAPLFEDVVEPDAIAKTIQGIVWMFKAYDLALVENKRMDFDDQKLRAYYSMLENSSLKQLVCRQYTEIIVDEFQDINKLDFQFIKLLAEQSRLVVVGDDDQAIYGFRGCSPEYIINLGHHLGRDVKSYELSINYRCPPNIIGHANKLIQNNNPNRIQKNPIPSISKPASIVVANTHSSSLEARSIVEYIKSIRRQKYSATREDFGYQNFAVLYRTNAQSLPLQIEFILNDIPYHVRKQDNILHSEMLAKILSILQVRNDIAANKKSKVKDSIATAESFFWALQPKEKAGLAKLFEADAVFDDMVESPIFTQTISRSNAAIFPSTMRELVRKDRLTDCLALISSKFRGVYGLVGSLDDVMEERVPLGEIFDIAGNFEGKIGNFIDMISKAIERARSQHAGEAEHHGVSFRTYFKAKGLQWHTVILMACNEGVIPHRRAPIQDERRLFYVALTRASANLFVSYVKNVGSNKVEPSSFLYQAGLLLQ